MDFVSQYSRKMVAFFTVVITVVLRTVQTKQPIPVYENV